MLIFKGNNDRGTTLSLRNKLLIIFLLIEVFIVGGDSKAEWVETGPSGGGAFGDFAFDPSEDSRVYLTSDMVGVFVSDDAGDHWKWSSYGAVKQKGGIAVDPSDPNILYVVGQEGIYQTKDRAKHWNLVYSKDNGFKGTNNAVFGPLRKTIFGKPGQSIAVSPTGIVYVCTVVGDLLISRDKGKSFNRVSIGGKSAVRTVIPVEKKNVVAALMKDGVYLSKDEGATWEKTLPGKGKNILAIAVHPVRRKVLYALTSKGSNVHRHYKVRLPVHLYKSSDGGESWKVIKNFKELTIRKGRRLMDISNNGTIIILAAHEPLRSIDGGLTWSYPRAMTKKDDNFIYAVRHKWGGPKWSIYADPRKRGRWYMTGMQAVLRSDDDGQSWYYKINGLREQAYWFIRVNPIKPDIVIASDMDHGLIRSTDGGITWRDIVIINPYEECNQLRFSPNDKSYNDLYAFFFFPYPFISKSTDAGATWKVLKSWKNKKRMSMNEFALTQGSGNPVMYVGEPNVGIWKSTDEGKTWINKNKGLPDPEAITHIQFMEADARGYLYVGIASNVKGKGGIFTSRDGGETWVTINNGLHSLFVRNGSFEIDPNNPDILWVGSGAAVYRSKNRGSYWEKRIEGVKSRAILVLPGNSDVVYVASFTGGGFLEQYSSGIYKSVDGGNYFFEITGNLSRTLGSTYRIFDLEYGWENSNKIWAAPDGGGLIYTNTQ